MSIPDVPTRTSRKKRRPVTLDKGFDHRLFSYAAAAGAAGVAALSLAQPCQAEIVYTKAHQHIGSSYSLDLNNDGTVDFTITNTGSGGSRRESVSQNLWVHGAGTNQVWNNYQSGQQAYALAAGANVGPGDHFLGSGLMERCKETHAQTFFYATGSWVNAKERYLGFAFTIDGQTHYGWARLSSRVSGRECKSSVLLTGYAYETEAGKPIEAGIKNEKNETDGGDEVPANDKVSTQDPLSAMVGTLGKLALGVLPSGQPDSTENKK